MHTSIFVKSAVALMTVALVLPAFTVDANAAKRKASKLECAVHEWDPSDIGVQKGDCLQYKGKTYKAAKKAKKSKKT